MPDVLVNVRRAGEDYNIGVVREVLMVGFIYLHSEVITWSFHFPDSRKGFELKSSFILQDGSYKVALGSTGNGDLVTALQTELEKVRPKKSDKIKIMNGSLRGYTGKLIGIDGSDGIVKLDETYEVKILDMDILAKLAMQ